MQQFTVPQFIDVEDKIIGPITTRQFVIILICAMASAVAYRLADFALFLILAFSFFIIGGVIAFLKINGRPFHYFLLNFIQTIKKPKIRVWNHHLSKTNKELIDQKIEPAKQVIVAPRLRPYTKSKLAELSLVVDTGGAFQGDSESINIERRN